ncbi:hypothetical protein ACFX13_013417 [Malus domestica]
MLPPSFTGASSSSDKVVRGVHSSLIIKYVHDREVFTFNVSDLHNINHVQALIHSTTCLTDFEELIAESNHLVRNCYQSRYMVSPSYFFNNLMLLPLVFCLVFMNMQNHAHALTKATILEICR